MINPPTATKPPTLLIEGELWEVPRELYEMVQGYGERARHNARRFYG